jgi:hypothetical protein
VGCSYQGTPGALNGCLNDVACLRHLLTSRFGYLDSDITVLRDDVDPEHWPTRVNMLEHMHALLAHQAVGDSFFFSFSGHGKRHRHCMMTKMCPAHFLREMPPSVAHGAPCWPSYQLWSSLCPCDYKEAGEILEDELNRLLVHPLLPGVRLHCLIDACYSGYVMGLPWQARRGGGAEWKQRKVQSRICLSHKDRDKGGQCVHVGAAGARQRACDTNQLHGRISTGAATFCFIQAIEETQAAISYFELQEAMQSGMERLRGKSGVRGCSWRRGWGDCLQLLGVGSCGRQTPCICANVPFGLDCPVSL